MAAAPRVGLLPVSLGVDGAAALRRTVQRAEAVGLDHVAVGDHVSFHVGMGFDGLVGATAVLATSERLETNTAVYLLPLRHPMLVARQLADVAVLAPGRLTFGVGVGGEDPHEVASCGVDPKTRGRRMDACLEIVRGLLSGASVDHDSEFFHLDHALIAPAPVDPVPIVVGGRSDAAITRAGRFGDGWIGIWVSPRRYAEAVGQMDEVAASAGRDAPLRCNGLNVWCGVGATRDEAKGYVAPAMEAFYQLPYDRFERWSPAGTAAEVADALIPFAEAGCSIINLVLQGRSPEAELDAAAQIRERIIEGVQGA